MPISDENLVDQTPLIVLGKVLQVETGLGQFPETVYELSIDRVLKGYCEPNLLVTVPGGLRDDGLGLKVFGAPTFQANETIVLFLEENEFGGYGVHHLMLGAFHQNAVAGKTYTYRDLRDSWRWDGGEGDPSGHVREFSKWLAWIADRANGDDRVADYWVNRPPHWETALVQKYNLTEIEGHPLRWREFGQGGTIRWFTDSKGQPGMADGGTQAIRNAMATWNRAAEINYSLQGTTGNLAGLTSFDQENTIIFDDPNGTLPGSYQCETGGLVAYGACWYNASNTHVYNGVTYTTILAADIVTQDGAACLFGRHDGVDGEEVFAHEFGHTLGLGHACGGGAPSLCQNGRITDQAIMRDRAHADGRGAVLGWDDREAITRLYKDTHGSGDGVKTRLVFPWVSHSATFGSQIIINNLESDTVTLWFTATRSNGETFYATKVMDGNCFFKQSLDSLFPDLTYGPGLTLLIEADLERVYGSWVTFNRQTATGFSPAKSPAVRMPGSGTVMSEQAGTAILFSYLPLTDGFISAPVVVNLSDAPADVTLTFFDQQGRQVGEAMVYRDLPPFWPYPMPASAAGGDGDLQMVATSTAMLTGVDFVFNGAGEPAMGAATAIAR